MSYNYFTMYSGMCEGPRRIKFPLSRGMDSLVQPGFIYVTANQKLHPSPLLCRKPSPHDPPVFPKVLFHMEHVLTCSIGSFSLLFILYLVIFAIRRDCFPQFHPEEIGLPSVIYSPVVQPGPCSPTSSPTHYPH